MVDQSEHMNDIIDWMPVVTSELESAVRGKLRNASVQMQYAMVIFAHGNDDPSPLLVKSQNGEHFVDRFDFEVMSFVQNKRTVGPRIKPRIKNGFEAMMTGLKALKTRQCAENASTVEGSFEAVCLKELVLLTNSDHQHQPGSNATLEQVLEGLLSSETNLHAAVSTSVISNILSPSVSMGIDALRKVYFQSSEGAQVNRTDHGIGQLGEGYGNTNADYGELALLSGGSVWNTDLLSSKEQPAVAMTRVFSYYLADHLQQVRTAFLKQLFSTPLPARIHAF